jgi:hypothetical protein
LLSFAERKSQGIPHLTATRDASAANEICNNPTVLPGLSLGVIDRIDLTPLVTNPRNHLLMGEFGGALLIWVAPGVYDVHDFVLPEGRGSWARDAAQDVFAFVFDVLGARLLFTQTPVENRASRMFNRILGFQSGGIHEAILWHGAEPRAVEYFTMEAKPCR